MAETSSEVTAVRVVGRNKKADVDEIDLKPDDFELGDFERLQDIEVVSPSKKMAARRKIELYWERKRLREQIGDFDDIDLDF